MQAIITKYIPATDTKPSRVKASCAAGSVTIAFDGDYSQSAHRTAAHALIRKLKWDTPAYGKWYEGGLPCGTGSVFVSTWGDSL